jgi:hypothetical protein
LSGTDLLHGVFMMVAIPAFLDWALNTQPVQTFMRNATEGYLSGQASPLHGNEL